MMCHLRVQGWNYPRSLSWLCRAVAEPEKLVRARLSCAPLSANSATAKVVPQRGALEGVHRPVVWGY